LLIDDIEGGFRNEKHRKQWRSTLRTHAATLIEKPIGEISTEDIVVALKPIWLELPETASRVRGRIERVLDAAKAKGHRTGENPARWRGHLDLLLPNRLWRDRRTPFRGERRDKWRAREPAMYSVRAGSHTVS